MSGLNLSPRPPLAPAYPWPWAGGDPIEDTHIPQSLGALAKASLVPGPVPVPGCPRGPSEGRKSDRNRITVAHATMPPGSQLQPASLEQRPHMNRTSLSQSCLLLRQQENRP